MGVFEGIPGHTTRGVRTEPPPVLCTSCFFLERERTEGAAGSSLGSIDDGGHFGGCGRSIKWFG